MGKIEQRLYLICIIIPAFILDALIMTRGGWFMLTGMLLSIFQMPLLFLILKNRPSK